MKRWLILLFFISGCSSYKPPFLLSVTPTPPSWDGVGFTKAFNTAKENVKIVSITDPVDWWYAAGKTKEEAKCYKDYQWQQIFLKDFDTFIQVDPYPSRVGPITNLPAGFENANFSNPILRKAFISECMLRADLYHPKWMCLGMEINSYCLEHPEDVNNIVSLCKETKVALKSKYPSLIVFVSFQYEQFISKKQSTLLTLFSDMDAVGISTYPLAFNQKLTVNAIPSDYYSRINTKQPVIFSEVGWQTDSKFGGSEQSQLDFLVKFPSLVSKMNVIMANYYFLYDAVGFGEVFDSMGLIYSNGNKKLALSKWNGLK